MFKPKKLLGQHWLDDIKSLNAIVGAANIRKDDVILEVGPGLGSLTEILINKSKQVWAVELDNELVDQLSDKFKTTAINLVNQDILKFDFNQLPKNYKIIANIPYYLTSHLLRTISETTNPPQIAVLLVQKEVAERVCAEPGQMSILSVTTQMHFEVSLGQIVPAELFTPPPKVDSQILILNRRKIPLFGYQDSKPLFILVKAGFSEKRKMLRSSLSGGLHITKTQADELLMQTKIDPNLRAQNLTLKNWLALSKTWQKYKV